MSINEENELLQKKIGFSNFKGMNLSLAREMLNRIGGINNFYALPTHELWQKFETQNSFCTDLSRKALLEIGRRELDFTLKNNIKPLFCDDAEFPSRLKECDDAPSLIYTLGKCNLNAKHIVSIVGTRRATAYGQRFTSELVSGLASLLDDIVIVSGLAYGIDVAAHKAALENGIPTVAVVAHGLKTIYPADHREVAKRIVHNGGAIVTEYCADAPIHRGNFLARNRIVAGIADATIIVESDEKGGAMVTASIAYAYNRDVFAAPGRVTDRYSSGPLKLITLNRAALIRSAEDLIEQMNWVKKSIIPTSASKMKIFNPENLGEEQKKIVEYLRYNNGATVNDMVSALGMSYSLLSARLMEMEMDDILTALPGAAYSLNM